MTTVAEETYLRMRDALGSHAALAIGNYVTAILAESRPSSEPPAMAGGAPSDMELTRIYEDALRATRHHTRDKWFVECLRALYEAGARAERERNKSLDAGSGGSVDASTRKDEEKRSVSPITSGDSDARPSTSTESPEPVHHVERLCQACGGHGDSYHNGPGGCLVCHGTGKAQAEKCPEPLPECPRCHGKKAIPGMLKGVPFIPCPDCQATGTADPDATGQVAEVDASDAMLCAYGCDRQIERGLDDYYHCPSCMKSMPLPTVARAAFRRGAVSLAPKLEELRARIDAALRELRLTKDEIRPKSVSLDDTASILAVLADNVIEILTGNAEPRELNGEGGRGEEK